MAYDTDISLVVIYIYTYSVHRINVLYIYYGIVQYFDFYARGSHYIITYFTIMKLLETLNQTACL